MRTGRGFMGTGKLQLFAARFTMSNRAYSPAVT
jgi:hypothetical protein